MIVISVWKRLHGLQRMAAFVPMARLPDAPKFFIQPEEALTAPGEDPPVTVPAVAAV